MLEALLRIIAPHTCLVCHAEGSLLCQWCKHDAIDVVPDRCYRCFSITQDAQTCQKCRKTSTLSHVWVRSIYADTSRELLYGLKFQRTKAAARQIAELLDEAIPVLPHETIVTYVPTATSRVRLRGYDQSRLIAREFAKIRSLECTTLLLRHGQARQVRSDRTQRFKQAANAYSIKSLGKVNQKRILLVDDIMTTGATLEAVSKLLKKSGAAQIDGAIFAQKQ